MKTKKSKLLLSMIIQNKMRFNILIVISYTFIILLFYHKSFLGYFQGDEWYYFSQFLPLTRQQNGIFSAIYKSIFDIQSVSGGGHLTPIYNIIWYICNKLFQLNYLPYILTSLLLHVFNSFLVYYLVLKLTKNKTAGILAGIFFAISYVHHQAVTWIMAFIPTVLSATFFLLSLIYALKATVNGKSNKFSGNILFSLLFALFAFLTKESSVILLILIPVILLLRNKKYLNKLFFKYFIGLCLLYLPFRFITPLITNWILTQTGNITKTIPIGADLHLFRLITYPVKAFVEVFVPQGIILGIAEFLTPYAYPLYGAEKAIRGINFLTFTQGPGSDMVIYFFAFILMLIFVRFIRYLKKTNRVYYEALILGIAIIILSTIPLIMIATYAPWWGYVSFIDSRHLYLTSTGGSILFSLGIIKLAQIIINNVVLLRLKNYHAVILFTIIWGVVQFVYFQNDLQKNADTATQRKNIIQSIISVIPPQKNKKLIVVESNTGYYGFPTIPPFQTNLGQILTIHYYADGYLPMYFLTNNFLTKKGLLSEGYVQKDEYGFGYFMSRKALQKYTIKNPVSIEVVYCFFWDGRKNSLRDITTECRKELYLRKTEDTVLNML